MAQISIDVPTWKKPSTRFIVRKTSSRGWILGVLVTILVNGGIILVLAQISHVAIESPPVRPDAIRHFSQLPPPQPPEQPVEQSTEQSQDMPAPVDIAVPLPALALPPLGGDPGFSLPALGDETPVAMPWTLPTFHAIEAAPSILSPGTEAFDQPPELAESFDLERFYPSLARVHHVEGESIVRITVDPQGVVTSCTVMRSTPVGVFDQAVKKLALSLHYHPAMRAGHPSSALVNLTITWTLR